MTAIEILQEKWNKNADEAEYMLNSNPRLQEILEENDGIKEAIKILSNVEES